MQEYIERQRADRTKNRPMIYKDVFVMKDTLKSNEKERYSTIILYKLFQELIKK